MKFLDARKSRPLRSGIAILPRRSTAIVLTLCLIVGLPRFIHAVEPAEQFLQGLQDRGLNELALDYLERMQTSQLVDDEFRQQIPYYRGVVLIEQSRQTMDPATRSRILGDARSALERYVEKNPQNVRGAEAQLQLASVQLSQGQQLISRAWQLPADATYAAQRQSLGVEARAAFTDALEMFEVAESIYSRELEELPPTQNANADNGSGNRRQEYRARVAQLRFLAAQTKFETAQTYPFESEDYTKLHQEAAQDLATVYDEFARTFMVGLYARLYEGRCYEALSQHQQALGCYEDILAQPNVLPPFRKLIASAVHRKAELLASQEKYDAAIETANASLRDASDTEDEMPEWLAVRFRLAVALQKKSEAPDASSTEKRKLLAEARDAYRFVAAAPGEFQTAARTAVASLVQNYEQDRKAPRDFQAAYDAGKDALASYNAAKIASPSAKKNNPAALPDLHAQMEQGKEDARYYFRAATTLVEDDTEEKLLNEVRYFLSWLYWESEDYYRAAVLGEFLARRFPDHAAARSAAKLAMASYERLYSQAAVNGNTGSDSGFEARRMAQIAEFITRRWPNTEDADAAQSVLVSFAIRTNRVDDAEKLLQNASPEVRPQLELQLGNALWTRYLELANRMGAGHATADGNSPAQAQLQQLKQSAVEYLRNGLEAVRKEPNVSDSAAAAGLYLAQAYLSEDKYAEAVSLLEDENLGPLSLISRQQAADARPQYAVETYKAALRAYVLTSPPQAQKALDVMQSLQKVVKEAGANDTQLTQIYVSLGVALEKQLDQLRTGGRDREAERVAAAFAQFLEEIASRQSEANWPTRVWLAQTYFSMAGTGTQPTEVPRLNDVQQDYLQKARNAYIQLVTDAEKDPNLAPSQNSILAAKFQLGECYRALGQYKKALDVFSSILAEKESSLSVQRAAAYTYQQRGQKENAQWLERAIHGGYKLRSTGENRIWGWLKISQIAARAARRNEKYRDTFFEARINAARCRYLAAMKQSGSTREQDLSKAKQGIQSLAQLYPNLGGAKWRGQFDALLKKIQSAAGEQPAGLSEFKTLQRPAS